MAKRGNGSALILYDGLCALCDGWVWFVLKRDHQALFRFAPLQGRTAKRILRRQGRSGDRDRTVFLILDFGTKLELLLDGSRAVFGTLRLLGKPWSILSYLRVLPLLLTDGVYRLVARFRYGLVGRYDACPVPPAQYGSRFLD